MEIERAPKKLPHVPTEQEIRGFYEAVWNARRATDVVMIKTLLYTGVRVSELVRIRTADVDLDSCRIRINQGKGAKDRYVPFPAAFKETLALHIDAQQRAGASHLFESSWKKPYSDRGVRKILARYATAAGITGPISPHRLRHFLFTRLKTQGIDDALIASSLTPGTPPANRLRSTHASRSPTRRTPTTRRSPAIPCEAPLVCGW